MNHMSKREDYISWDEYFMGVSLLASMRSKDPNTQVGACIVGDDNKIISVGYNGFPRGCSDDVFPWERSGANMNDTKYPFVCHAELNAILMLRFSPATSVQRRLFKAESKRLYTYPTNTPKRTPQKQAKKCLAPQVLSRLNLKATKK